MGTVGMDPKDWQSLLHQTNDLVAQVDLAMLHSITSVRSQPSYSSRHRTFTASQRSTGTFSSCRPMLDPSGPGQTSSGR